MPDLPAPAMLHEQLEVSLFQVQTAPYHSLQIVDMTSPHWIVSHVQSGEVESVTCGLFHQVNSGQVMVHPPNLPFSEYAARPGQHQWLMVDLAFAPHLDFLRVHPVSPVVTLTDIDMYFQTFVRLEHIWHQSSSLTRDLRLTALTFELVCQIVEAWQQNGGVARPAVMQTAPDRFVGLLTYMQNHLDQRLTRDDLAAHVFLHPSYFDRLFRSAYGLPPMQMLREMRLRRAQEHLERTEDILEHIADACGFGDAAHLSRLFRQRFGQSPSQYRKSVKQTRTSYISP